MKFGKFLVLALAVFLLIPASAAMGEVGVTDTEITVGMTTPLSGPAAPWGSTARGAKAWLEYINDQGGVHGRKFKIILKDDGYNPARAMANLQEMKNKVFAVVALLGSAPCAATKDFFPENKIPLIHGYGNVRIWADEPKEKLKYTFISYPDYEDEVEYLGGWAIENQAAQNIAVFYQNDEYGHGCIKGLELAVKAAGGKAKIVAQVPYEVTERALSTHAQKLKESNADTVFMFASPTQGAIITKEFAKLSWLPKRYVTFPLSDPIMFKIAGEAWEGTFMTTFGSSAVMGTKQGDETLGILTKYDEKLAGMGNLAIFGAHSAQHFVKALEIAGKDLDREKLIKAMESIQNWQAPVGGTPATYGPDRHHGTNSVLLCQAKDGKVVPLEADKYESFKSRF